MRIPAGPVPPETELGPMYRKGIELFNSRSFFDAHEALEDVWRDAPQPQKRFLQGLIQAAVCFHHYQKGNLRGAKSLLIRAIEKLGTFPDTYDGIRTGQLLQGLGAWQRALAAGTEPPPFPNITLVK